MCTSFQVILCVCVCLPVRTYDKNDAFPFDPSREPTHTDTTNWFRLDSCMRVTGLIYTHPWDPSRKATTSSPSCRSMPVYVSRPQLHRDTRTSELFHTYDRVIARATLHIQSIIEFAFVYVNAWMLRIRNWVMLAYVAYTIQHTCAMPALVTPRTQSRICHAYRCHIYNATHCARMPGLQMAQIQRLRLRLHMSHTQHTHMSHFTHTKESYHTHEWSLPVNITSTNESRHTYRWVMPHK